MRGYSLVVCAVAVLALGGCASGGTEADDYGLIGYELAPGTYISQVFDTPVTFTVADGWKVFEDEPGQFGLARMSNDGPPLLVLRDIDAAAPGCDAAAAPGVGRSSSDLASWFAEHEGLEATTPSDVSVGGLDGRVIDVSLAASWSDTCPFSHGTPIVMTIVGSALSAGLYWGVDPETIDRMWFLDLPADQGGNVVVVGEVCCGVDPDDQLTADQAVVDTFQFSLPGE